MARGGFDSDAQSPVVTDDSRLSQLSSGVSAIGDSVASGEFGTAMNGLEGLFDNGIAGFQGVNPPVAGRESTGKTLLEPASNPARNFAIQETPPPPGCSAPNASDAASEWPLATAAGAFLLALLQKGNEGASDVDREAKKQNPKADEDVSRGIAREKEYHEERQFNDHVADQKPKENGLFDIKPTGGNATGGGTH